MSEAARTDQSIRVEHEIGRTTCVCESCLTKVPARILASSEDVSYEKVCPIHGRHRTVVSTDPPYFLDCREQATDLAATNLVARTQETAPPQTAMAIIEVIDGCDAKCPTCSAASDEITNVLSMPEVDSILTKFAQTTNRRELLMVSGGEPAMHPRILEILELVHVHGFKRVMLITNGFRIARDPDFVDSLAALGPWLEVYLQFDSLSPEVLRVLRGEDLREVRLRALSALERRSIATTLVCVVKKGLNDVEIGSTIDTALAYDCVRGVTFQPIRALGRTHGFNPATEWLTLSDVRKAIIAHGRFTSTALVPHPCNPETICIGYISRASGECITNEIISPATAREAGNSMFFTPMEGAGLRSYEDVFRVCVVSYMDRFDYTVQGAERSCIHFLLPNGQVVPLEEHYLFPPSSRPVTVPVALVRSR